MAVTSCEAGSARLLRLGEIAEELGWGPARDEARDLAARISEGRFYVACVGQFKRGKSTLINALIGAPVLPVGFAPVTAVPTVVRFGEQLEARVRGQGASWGTIAVADLEQYVSEEHNPENKKGIVGVEVFVPSPLLSTGMCLVDTPGLGSVFSSNAAATQAFVPHIDAALVVVGADPPLAGEELTLVEIVARRVRHLVLVLNKADRTTEVERAAAAEFTQKLLEQRLRRPVGPILEVSAAERIENRGPQRDWQRLNDVLLDLVHSSGRQLVSAACERGLERLSEELLAVLSEQRSALRRPIEESKRRITNLKETAVTAKRSLVELGFLMMAERQRICSALIVRHRAFLDSVLPQARTEFKAGPPRGFGPSYRRRLMRQVREIARRHVAPWLPAEQDYAEKEYRRTSERFVELGHELLGKLAKGGMTELAQMPHALDAEAGFRVKSRFSFAELIELAQPASPLRWIADVALGCVGAHGVIEREAREFLERLLETNATRVQSDVLNRLEESQNRLEGDLRRLLHQVVQMAERALAQAKQAQQAGAAAVDQAVERLDRLQHEICALQPGGAA